MRPINFRIRLRLNIAVVSGRANLAMLPPSCQSNIPTRSWKGKPTTSTTRALSFVCATSNITIAPMPSVQPNPTTRRRALIRVGWSYPNRPSSSAATGKYQSANHLATNINPPTTGKARTKARPESPTKPDTIKIALNSVRPKTGKITLPKDSTKRIAKAPRPVVGSGRALREATQARIRITNIKAATVPKTTIVNRVQKRPSFVKATEAATVSRPTSVTPLTSPSVASPQ